MNIVIVTDTWLEQINGVTRTLVETVKQLKLKGFDVTMVEPSQFKTFKCPTYQEIPLSYNVWKVAHILDNLQLDHLHIATEGTLGFSAKLWADKRKILYTTGYHTRFPEYILDYFGGGLKLAYRAMKVFHGKSSAVLVNTPSMMTLLSNHGMKNLKLWGRGVDTDLFKPDGPKFLTDLPRPILMNVGRVALEKNLPDFYQLKTTGSKVQVGGGPMFDEYKERFPDVHFVGPKVGEELASYYRSGDVFVFPSLTDTYGLVMLESIASGVPVAAYPVTGPKDVLTDMTGCMDINLDVAVKNALNMDKSLLRNAAMEKSWSKCTDDFISYLVPA